MVGKIMLEKENLFRQYSNLTKWFNIIYNEENNTVKYNNAIQQMCKHAVKTGDIYLLDLFRDKISNHSQIIRNIFNIDALDNYLQYSVNQMKTNDILKLLENFNYNTDIIQRMIITGIFSQTIKCGPFYINGAIKTFIDMILCIKYESKSQKEIVSVFNMLLDFISISDFFLNEMNLFYICSILFKDSSRFMYTVNNIIDFELEKYFTKEIVNFLVRINSFIKIGCKKFVKNSPIIINQYFENFENNNILYKAINGKSKCFYKLPSTLYNNFDIQFAVFNASVDVISEEIYYSREPRVIDTSIIGEKDPEVWKVDSEVNGHVYYKQIIFTTMRKAELLTHYIRLNSTDIF